MAKIRILQVIGGNEIGGAEEHVLALCKGLDPEIFEVFLACLCDGPLAQAARNQGIPVIIINMGNPLDVFIIPELVRQMKALAIDIVHTHGSRANLTARLAGKWAGIPIVTTIHSSLAQDYISRPASLVAKVLDRVTTPLATGIVTVSQFLQPEAKKRGAKRTVTIYNGIDPAKLAKIDLLDNIYSEIGITPGGPLVGIIGRLHPVKGHVFFLEAAALISANHPATRFLIVGSGPLEADLRNKVQELGLENKVIFTGYCPNVQRILAILDVLCLPSLSEGMGLVLLEAMYFSKPVVASRVGGIPEV
ncbi:MAG TPA: glycosyltransferase, partial [Verrucomicrobiae bacterium]|nr:glycosyltransferase [Verrucomicrobiae bacterium]